MIQGINHITLAVSNVEKSFDFYTGILKLKPVAKWSTGAYLTAGNTWIALNEDKTVKQSYRPDYTHIAFTCNETGFTDLRNQLLLSGCSEFSENKSEGNSFYFRDPDGHKLEIHVGDLNSRLRDMKENPWDKFEFFG